MVGMGDMSPGNKLRQSHTKQSMFAAAQQSLVGSNGNGNGTGPPMPDNFNFMASHVEMEEEIPNINRKK